MARIVPGIPRMTARIAKTAPMMMGGLHVVGSLVAEPVLFIEVPVLFIEVPVLFIEVPMVSWVADILILV
jgi:hypothetical protein